MADDPFAVLGLDGHADAAALRTAWLRMAKDLHPDRAGGDADAMRRINVAYDAALADLAGRAPRDDEVAESVVRPQDLATEPVPRAPGRFAHDVASFTIESLPAEAFEALLIVATWLGEVIVDDPPYQLDVELGEPYECWCRLDLVPDAGASTISLTLATFDGRAVPDLDAVRDAWVANLNTLGRPE